MAKLKLHLPLKVVTMVFLLNVVVASASMAQFHIINGVPEHAMQMQEIKNCIVRKESLIIKNGRVYIQLLIDKGARRITDHDRYSEIAYLLPSEVVYDDMAKRIFYYTGDDEIEVGRKKSFLGFMPYIALADGVKIISSPTDAKLLVEVNRGGNYKNEMLESVIHSDTGMEETLKEKCGQCHILEYIFSHKNWVEEDIIHAFNRLQMERREVFSEETQEVIDLFKKYQKGEVDRGKLSEFKALKSMGERDVVQVAEGVYMNNCAPCHKPSEVSDISMLYSKKRCKTILERMKESEPSLFLNQDVDKLADYLWRLKLKSCEN